MANKSFQDLVVWQRSMDLAEQIYKLANLLPKEELFSLSDQMRRAAVSVPSNIAEGQQRNTPKEFAKFLSYAKGSTAELETQLLLCERLNMLTHDQTDDTLKLCREIGRMINGLLKSL